MKLKYQIAMIGAGVLLLLLPLLRRRLPQFVRDFFTAVTDPVNLATFRIVFFVTLAFSFSISNTAWFGSVPADLQFPPQGLHWLVKHLPISAAWAWWASVVLLLCCITAALGLFTRVSSILCVLLGFYVLGIPQFYGKINHYHHLLWFAAIMAVSPCADVLSIDAIRSSWKRADHGVTDPPGKSAVYALPLRFIWLLMGAIYFSAGFWKVWTGGYKWAFSDNPKIMMYNKWLELGGWRPLFRIDQYPFFYQASAAATILFELLFIVIIFFPQIRFLAVLGGLAFHNMTNLFMRISFWNLQVCYVAFVDWARVWEFVGERFFKEPMYLIYDGNCKLCRRTIASLRTLDVFRRVTYLNALDDGAIYSSSLNWLDSDKLLRDMHAVVGKTASVGFDAYRALAFRIPLLWPLLPFLYLWPISAVGGRAYRRVADSRTCSIATSSPAINDIRTSGRPQLAAITLVGSVLLYAAILTAVGKIQSWPVAGYPTFEDLDRPEIAIITIDVQDGNGRLSEINPVKEQSLHEVSPERLMALLDRIISTPNEDDKNRLLRAFWAIWVRENPSLNQAVEVKFYQDTLSSLPDRQGENPIERKLLYEWRVPK
jgi:predicted DCC family thiol-disulfide oxidoreductase YuxK